MPQNSTSMSDHEFEGRFGRKLLDHCIERRYKRLIKIAANGAIPDSASQSACDQLAYGAARPPNYRPG
jgi:hypothetical protein